MLQCDMVISVHGNSFEGILKSKTEVLWDSFFTNKFTMQNPEEITHCWRHDTISPVKTSLFFFIIKMADFISLNLAMIKWLKDFLFILNIKNTLRNEANEIESFYTVFSVKYLIYLKVKSNHANISLNKK